MTSVEIGEGITAVGKYAFYGMKKLESIQLPDGLTSIGSYAFSDCSQLTSVTLPDTVKTVESYAFNNDKALTSVVLPAKLNAFNPYAFTNTGIMQYQISEDNQYFSSVDGILYSKSVTKLIAYPPAKRDTVYTLPETVTSVGENAFYGQQYLTSLTFHDGITAIGSSALNSMASLNRVIFLGDAPTLSSALPQKNITYYCYFDKAGWEKIRASAETAEWIDLAQYGDSDKLTVTADKTSLQPGETAQLTAQINPVFATDFVWSTDHPEIANVFADGRVLAVNPGTVTVTAASPDGTYSGSVKLEITGDAYEIPPHEIIELTEGELDFTSVSKPCLQIPCKELCGIYLLYGNELKLYSLITHTAEPVCTFQSCSKAYAANNKLYFTDGTRCFVYDLLQQTITLQFPLTGYSIDAVGADTQGRIYLAGSTNSSAYKLFLFDDKGEMLSSTNSDNRIYCFNGFDESSGNFFMETYYNWVYWGYDHPGHAATMGSVQDNVIMNARITNSVLIRTAHLRP